MRQTGRNVRRRRRKGCGSGVLRFIFFVAVIICVGLYIKNTYNSSDLAMKIRKTQYPVKYEYFVETYSQKYNLDKYLVYAVIRTESRFDSMAVSSADAKGLMQLTGETGAECARKTGLDGYSENKLFDPETNIQLGCYYLSYLISRYESKDVAIAAYNGGPGNVDTWLKDSSCSDGNGNLTYIPIKETRDYVNRVKEAESMYKSIYENRE